MAFHITYNEAIKIQAEQVDHYSRNLEAFDEARFRARVSIATQPCTFNPDEPRSVIEINTLVPRGGWLELMLGIDNSDLD